ncbi:MAG: Crp/Fnr family transcriptional regulator [Leptolyngbyaceae cyanobacterium MO_188.B28]|nr:Crp/Fnr family transcriptional regulator [Leptolyngbyaceae cyanobacterium MO_188.B28]
MILGLAGRTVLQLAQSYGFSGIALVSLNLSTLAEQTHPRGEFRELLEQLYRERTLIPFSTGQSIPLRSEELWVICRGAVQLYTIQPDGSETLLGLLGPSMPLGLPLTTVDPYWATALTDVDLLSLSMVEVESSPVLMAGLFRHLTLRLQQTEAWLSLAGKRLVADRLRHLLILIAKEFGQVEPDGVHIMLRLTHHQLATAIGTTRVTVTRLLKDFRDEGWLMVDQRQMIVAAYVFKY